MRPAEEDRAVHVRITGRVQGVWFRGWSVEEARRRRLNGWVRNRRDGSVEALFVGPVDVVEQMLAACWKGPDLARVDDVKASPGNSPSQTGFHQLPTS